MIHSPLEQPSPPRHRLATPTVQITPTTLLINTRERGAQRADTHTPPVNTHHAACPSARLPPDEPGAADTAAGRAAGGCECLGPQPAQQGRASLLACDALRNRRRCRCAASITLLLINLLLVCVGCCVRTTAGQGAQGVSCVRRRAQAHARAKPGGGECCACACAACACGAVCVCARRLRWGEVALKVRSADAAGAAVRTRRRPPCNC